MGASQERCLLANTNMLIPTLMKPRPRRELLLVFLALALFAGALQPFSKGDDADAGRWATDAELSTRKLEKDPHNEKAWEGLVRARLRQGDWKRAEKAIGDWHGAVAHPSSMNERLTAELAVAKEESKAAIAAWNAYLALEPGDRDGWLALSLACANEGRHQEAVDATTHALTIKKDVFGFTRRAESLIRLHDWDGVAADGREANKLDPLDPTTKTLFPVFERSKEWVPEVTKLDAAIAADPKNAGLLIDRAEWLVGEGLTDAGSDDVEAALKLDPKSLRVRFWNGIMAWEHNQSGNAGDVMQYPFAKVTVKFEIELKTMDASTDPETRAQFLLKNDQPLMALHEVGGVSGSVAKAQALYDLSRLPEAGAAARRAVEAHADDADAWLLLARIELGNGNIKEALDALDRSSHLKKSKEADDLRKEAIKELGKK